MTLKPRELTYAEIRRRMKVVESDPAAARAAIASKNERELRAALESKRGETYTDAEWSEAADNLLGFFAILAEWKERDDQHAG